MATILLIPCVSAEEITIDNNTSIQDSINQIDNNSTVDLTPGTYKESGININKDLTLQGIGNPNETIIDGEHKQSIILVDSTSKLTIKNITFINAFSTTNGGAIKVNGGGHLVLDNCIFINNTVDSLSNEAMGGAVSVTGYYHAIETFCKFGTLEINNCYFYGNYAGTDGGATNTFFSTAYIYNSLFENNYANRDGGGVSTRGTDVTFVENCTFINNRANIEGGALKNYLSQMTVTNCTIVNNTAGDAAAVIRNCGALTMTYSKVINNTAGNYASIMEAYLEEDHNIPVTVFNYNEFIGNTARKEALIHIYEMGKVDHNFENNYWGSIIPNSAEWNKSFITNNACPNPTTWLELVNETIISDNITQAYNSPYDFNATFLDKFGFPLKNIEITFTINNASYSSTTDKNGMAALPVKLTVGSYNITSINPRTNEKIVNSITILPRIVENKDLTKDYLDSKTYKVKIISDDGKAVGANVKVTVVLNGVKSTLKTDANGYITKKINLVAGKYSISVTYKDYTIKNKITVKQILKSKNVSVKVKKPITVQAALKYSNGKALKNKKITFKFKGKTYSAITNSKGIAKVTIKNKYKAGKYTIYIKYVNQQIKQTITIKK